MKKQSLRSQKGQMTIEAVLLLTILFSVFAVVQRQLKGKQFAQRLIAGPWASVQGMVENGVWVNGSDKTRHPNNYTRRASPEPLL